MEIYINASCAISAQHSFDEESFLNPVEKYQEVYMKSIDPDYKSYIDSKVARRMSRIIKMGVTAANYCLKTSGVDNPDAIITGTALGCLEDTTKFLSSMIDNDERLLTPTSFIQSTHNTISAQIALLINCHNYNFTYVHRGFSFESSLIDAMMLIEEKEAQNVLVGGLDEISEEFYLMRGRIGLWKKGITSNLSLLEDKTTGTIAGEGAGFFLLSNEKSKQTHAEIIGVTIFFNPEEKTIEKKIETFLAEKNLILFDIDLILMGNNGDVVEDLFYTQLESGYFAKNQLAYFKHLCGEFYTSSAFALWLANKIIKDQYVPEIIRLNDVGTKSLKNILIYNQNAGKNHSLILVSQC